VTDVIDAPAAGEIAAGSRRRRRRRAILALSIVLVLIAGGYATAAALAPLPTLRPVLSTEAETQIDADAEGAAAAVEAQRLPTAIGWADGDEVWSNDDASYPIASLTKLVTVLVCLEAQPLEPGADGPAHTWTAEDQRRQYEYLAMQGVAYPIPVGTEVTTRQMLELSLLPSANDFAAAYAYSVFGSNDAFVDAVDAWKKKHGLDSLQVVEPTGLDERDRANAADLVRIARLALQNPTMSEFTRMKSAELPWGIGRVVNTNPLLGKVRGVIGLKTGSLNVVGYNLVVAQESDASGREVVNIAVALARPTKGDRAASGRAMLTAMADLPREVGAVEGGEVLGSVSTWQGDRVGLVAQAGAGAVLLPGEALRRTVELGAVEAGPAGGAVGEVRVSAPTDVDPVPVVTSAPIVEPDYWWRLTHPAELFDAAFGG